MLVRRRALLGRVYEGKRTTRKEAALVALRRRLVDWQGGMKKLKQEGNCRWFDLAGELDSLSEYQVNRLVEVLDELVQHREREARKEAVEEFRAAAVNAINGIALPDASETSR